MFVDFKGFGGSIEFVKVWKESGKLGFVKKF